MSGRIRTIKPELLEDEKVAGLSSDEFRLFIGLFLVADDYGNFRANPTWLTGQVFWSREPSTSTREILASLRDAGLITLYEVNAQHYGHICGWSKHQKIDHPSRPKIPLPPPENVEKTSNVGQPREPSREDLEPSTIPRKGSGSGSGMEGKGGEASQPTTEPAPAPEPDPLPVAVATGPAPERSNSAETPEAKPKRKGRLPDSWAYTAQHRDKAYELGLDVDAEAEAFRDYHTAHGSMMANWSMAFHTWLRNAVRFGPAPSKAPEPTYLEIPDDAGTAMSLAEALEYCPPEHRGPIQEYLGGI